MTVKKTDLVNLLSSFPNISTVRQRQAFIDAVGLTRLADDISFEGETSTFFNNLIKVIVETDGPDGLFRFIDNLIASDWVGIDRNLTLEDLKAELENLDSRQWRDRFGYVTIPDPVIVEDCPYRGLFAFRETDAQYFFGREAVADKLVTAAESQSLVAVIGASGSGKSSVVFAGLVPQLRRQGNWAIASFRPGNTPFKHLASALVSLLETQTSEVDKLVETNKLATALLAKDLDLSDVITRIAAKQESARVLLVADQFEELYALCSEKKLRRSFLECLLRATEGQPNFTLVLTLRADFYGYALSDRSFADALQNADEKLGPMNRQELEDAIVKPAKMLGVELEAGLSDRILEAVGEEPGNLPLLQFALTQLWEKQSRGKLTHVAYDEIGGVEQALVKYADEVYNQLEEPEREKVRRAFIQLVSPGEGSQDTRRMATAGEVGAENWDLIRRLADRRLVVTASDETGEETVEMIHEALIKEWGTLREWMEESRQFRAWQTRLRERMREWETMERDEGELLRGASLLEAQEWREERLQELSEEEEEFIGLSLALRDREEEERQRRRQRTTTRLAMGLVAVSVFAAGAVWQWSRAVVGEQRALNAEMQWKITTLEYLADTSLERQLEAIQLGKELQNDSINLKNRIRGAYLLQRIFDFEQWKEYKTLEGHENRLYHVIFSPDGELLASASRDGDVRLWDADGKLKKILKGNSGHVTYLSFSPNSWLLASAHQNGIVRLWDADGRTVDTLVERRGKVTRVIFSPDGKLLASAGFDSFVLLWKLDDGTRVPLEGHEDRLYHVSFNKDSNLIASASEDGTVRLWQPDGTSAAPPLIGHEGPVYHVSFSPTDNLIASAGDDGTVRLWQPDGTASPPLEGHEEMVNHLNFSPDGNLIASASDDKTVRLWRRDGTLIHTLRGHQDKVWYVGFSHDGNLIASASEDNTVRLWKLDGTLVTILKGHKDAVRRLSFSFSPDDKAIATASRDMTVRLWRRDETPVSVLKAHQDAAAEFSASDNDRASERRDLGPQCGIDAGIPTVVGENVNHISFSPDSKLIASASSDKTVRLWNRDGTPAAPPLDHENPLYHASFSPDSKLLATGSEDGTVRLWNRDGTPATPPLRGHKDAVYHISFSFSPDGKLLATASEDCSVRLWQTDGTSVTSPLTGHDGLVIRVDFSPDGKLLATASEDKTVRLWELDGTVVKFKTALHHEDDVNHVSFSPDGKLLASASYDYTVRLWKPDGTEVATLKGHEEPVNHVSFSPDGKLLASASYDSNVRLWKPDGTEVATLEGHEGPLNQVSFSPDGKLLASASYDGTVRLWQTDGTLIAALTEHQKRINHISFIEDGKLLASASDDGTARIWNLNLDDMLAQSCDWVRDYLNTLPEEHPDKHLCDDIK